MSDAPVIDALREGPRTVAELMGDLGLKRNAVAYAVDRLERSKTVGRTGQRRRSANGGRPSVEYQLLPDPGSPSDPSRSRPAPSASADASRTSPPAAKEGGVRGVVAALRAAGLDLPAREISETLRRALAAAGDDPADKRVLVALREESKTIAELTGEQCDPEAIRSLQRRGVIERNGARCFLARSLRPEHRPSREVAA